MISATPRLVVEVLSESTEHVDRLVKLDEYKALETLDYVVIADPTRVEVGFWFRQPDRTWRHEILQRRDAVISMPELDLSVSLGSLYELVTLNPRPRPRLVWDDGDDPPA